MEDHFLLCLALKHKKKRNEIRFQSTKKCRHSKLSLSIRYRIEIIRGYYNFCNSIIVDTARIISWAGSSSITSYENARYAELVVGTGNIYFFTHFDKKY